MKQFVILAAILMVQACASTGTTLKVERDTAVNITGPISEAGGVAFLPPQLEDGRVDKARIGWMSDANKWNWGEITSEQPVDVIVENAITDALKDNGHSVTDDGKVRITGAVERFWFDTDKNVWSVEFIGDIQCTLDFIDVASNASIYTSSYSGNYKEKIRVGGSVTTRTEVMSKAVDKLIEDIVFDEDLKDALADYKQ